MVGVLYGVRVKGGRKGDGSVIMSLTFHGGYSRIDWPFRQGRPGIIKIFDE